MSNPSRPLLTGSVSALHTSNMYPYYPLGNFPTPWPLVLVNVILSLIVAFIGMQAAGSSWNSPTTLNRIRADKAQKKSWLQRYREAKAVRDGRTAIPQTERPHNELELEEEELDTMMGPPVLFAGMTVWAKAKLLGGFTYTTLRAVVALALVLSVAITGNGTYSAPSSTLLLLLSTQTFLSNRNMPRVMNLVLVVDSALAAAAFLIASYARFARGAYYGQLVLSGGNCPMYAPDCASEASRWTYVGCGDYSSRSKPPQDSYFAPYGGFGDLNTGFNVLFIIEAVISVFGTIWLLTVLLTIYEARHISVTHLSDLLRPIDRNQLEARPGKRKHLGWGLTVLISIFGTLGAVIVGILSIAGHVSQETQAHHTTYMDSLGPMVSVYNLSHIGAGGPNLGYGGNATSWTDCFVLTSPTSSNGNWNEWVEQNLQSLYRFAIGV